MISQNNQWKRKVLSKDCLVFFLVFLFMFLPIVFIHSEAKIKHDALRIEISKIEQKIGEVEKSVSELRQLLPVASADRWSKSMMKNYDRQLFKFLSQTNASWPDVETIKLTTPVIASRPTL